MMGTNTDFSGSLSGFDLNVRAADEVEIYAQNQKPTTHPTNMELLNADRNFDQYVLLLIDATTHPVCKISHNSCLCIAE